MSNNVVHKCPVVGTIQPRRPFLMKDRRCVVQMKTGFSGPPGGFGGVTRWNV